MHGFRLRRQGSHGVVHPLQPVTHHEISCRMRSIVAPCAGSVMIPGGMSACSSEAYDGALEFCRASEKSNCWDGLPDCLPDVLPPGIADSQSRVRSGRLRKRREIPVEVRAAKHQLDTGKQMPPLCVQCPARSGR
ncbi:hypothetical protein NDU88_006607 [Pleurodeles waltl]|uniref:Uncharacterized protein n=1 Tax=Pleurodeles waltl TaxID=8319 RepID=A0AAV7VQ42_PLEWA|nr:hypothetical protein NDU88_006607 [Pleurodeles waltl]